MAMIDRTEYILQAAQALGITLSEGELARVKIMFGVLEGAAALVRDTPIDDETTAAAVFRPGSKPKR
jgi:Protein of unknown function (DUF4089)